MNFFAIVHGENSESCSRMSKFVTLFSKLIWWISLEQNFFVQEKFSFCEWRKLFCDETHRKTQHFCSFFSKKNVIFFAKIFSRGFAPRTPHLLIRSLSSCIHYFPNRGIFPNRGKRGVLFHVQTEEWPKPRDVYKCSYIWSYIVWLKITSVILSF